MNEPPIEAQIVPETQALAIRPTHEIGLFRTDDPEQIIGKARNVAQALKDVIVKQGLVSRIQGKEYPRCEAWTLLGTMLGVFPVLVWSKPVEGGWEARVEARTKDGSIIGAAEAQCLRAERNWKDRDDFALRSMAQTRATAKCLRMPLGFVMSLSGFEPTPAEEMVSDHTHAQEPARPQAKPQPPKPEALVFPTDKYRAKMISDLKANPGDPNREIVTEYFRKVGPPFQLMEGEELEDLLLRFVPASKEQMRALHTRIASFAAGERAEPAFQPHPEPEANEQKPETTSSEAEDDSWRRFPMPFGKNAGVALEELETRYLFGLWANYKVETEYKGKPKKPETIAKDETFRLMLDLAGKHYEFTKPD